MTTEITEAERNFRWAYALLLELAQVEFKRDRSRRGQEWAGLVGSSHAVYLRQARERAGIQHDAFLEPIRSGKYDVTDLYDGATNG